MKEDASVKQHWLVNDGIMDNNNMWTLDSTESAYDECYLKYEAESSGPKRNVKQEPVGTALDDDHKEEEILFESVQHITYAGRDRQKDSIMNESGETERALEGRCRR